MHVQTDMSFSNALNDIFYRLNNGPNMAHELLRFRGMTILVVLLMTVSAIEIIFCLLFEYKYANDDRGLVLSLFIHFQATLEEYRSRQLSRHQ